eukprot:jgi/Mesen1/5338/ME000267S04485
MKGPFSLSQLFTWLTSGRLYSTLQLFDVRRGYSAVPVPLERVAEGSYSAALGAVRTRLVDAVQQGSMRTTFNAVISQQLDTWLAARHAAKQHAAPPPPQRAEPPPLGLSLQQQARAKAPEAATRGVRLFACCSAPAPGRVPDPTIALL